MGPDRKRGRPTAKSQTGRRRNARPQARQVSRRRTPRRRERGELTGRRVNGHDGGRARNELARHTNGCRAARRDRRTSGARGASLPAGSRGPPGGRPGGATGHRSPQPEPSSCHKLTTSGGRVRAHAHLAASIGRRLECTAGDHRPAECHGARGNCPERTRSRERSTRCIAARHGARANPERLRANAPPAGRPGLGGERFDPHRRQGRSESRRAASNASPGDDQ